MLNMSAAECLQHLQQDKSINAQVAENGCNPITVTEVWLSGKQGWDLNIPGSITFRNKVQKVGHEVEGKGVWCSIIDKGGDHYNGERWLSSVEQYGTTTGHSALQICTDLNANLTNPIYLHMVHILLFPAQSYVYLNTS